jgi:pimeloyl-ACP methyl ester carboxylesterase
MFFAEKTILTRHTSIRLTETPGQAMPIVMLHGSGSSRRAFDRQLSSPLADIHRMIAIDLPGHGESSDAFDPTETYTIPGLAAVVSEILAELGVKRAIFLGWSLGGHIAIELASYHPAVAGLMLSGTPPVPPGAFGLFRGFHAHWDLLLGSKATYTERDVARFARLCFGDSPDPAFLASIRRADGRLRANLSRSMLRGDGADQKRTVENANIPIAMINGADEPLVRLAYVAGLSYKSLWRGRCHVIEGAGHAPFWEKPDVFNLLFFSFVRDTLEREVARGRQDRQVAGAA